MDKIIRGLLEQFSAKHDYASLKESERFERFAAFAAVSPSLSSALTTEDICVGGDSDTGLDAIAVIVNGEVVSDVEAMQDRAASAAKLDVAFVFVQAETSEDFSGSKIGTFGFGVQDFFRELPQLPRNERVTAAADVMNAIYASSSKFLDGNPDCHLFYVSTGKWKEDPQLAARRQAVIDDLSSQGLFGRVTFECLGARELQKRYLQLTRAVSREFQFASRTPLPEIHGVTEAYIGLVSADVFVSLLQDDNGELMRSLFYDNVRDWQDFNEVNSEIKEDVGERGGEAKVCAAEQRRDDDR